MFLDKLIFNKKTGWHYKGDVKYLGYLQQEASRAYSFIFFFGSTVFFTATAVVAELVAAFALADALAIYYSLTDKLLAASNAAVETLNLGGG